MAGTGLGDCLGAVITAVLTWLCCLLEVSVFGGGGCTGVAVAGGLAGAIPLLILFCFTLSAQLRGVEGV